MDDIVTRLRDADDLIRTYMIDNDYLIELVAESASEIERLRKFEKAALAFQDAHNVDLYPSAAEASVALENAQQLLQWTEEWEGNVLLSKQSAADLLARIESLEKQCSRWQGNCAEIAQSSKETANRLIKQRNTWEGIADSLHQHLSRYSCLCNMNKCRCGYDDVMDMYQEYKDVY